MGRGARFSMVKPTVASFGSSGSRLVMPAARTAGNCGRILQDAAEEVGLLLGGAVFGIGGQFDLERSGRGRR